MKGASGERRMQIGHRAGTSSLGSWLYALSFVLFPLLLLWRPLFAGEAFFWGTPLLQFVPWQRMASAMWHTGHLPLWNPLVGCGAPLAANYQTAAFYPLNALAWLLPAEVALSWTMALHLALAGWGMYRWGRAIGLDPFPALIGALSVMGSGFLVTRVALFPSMALTFPWLPVWLWRVEALVQRGRPREATWLGLALGLGFLAGHAQTACYGVLLLVAYAMFRALQRAWSERARTNNARGTGGAETEGLPSALRRPVRRLATLLPCALAVGVGLAAVQLVPTAELMLQSHRSVGVTYDFAMTYSLWPWRLITLAAPDFFGHPGRGDYWGYATYWEDAGYVGVLPLLLAVGAVLGRKRREKGSRLQPRRSPSQTWFWTLSAALGLILALGKNTPVFPFLFRHVPGFDLFQAPARWLAVTTIALAALAALGAQGWPKGRSARRRGALWVALGAALITGGLATPHLVPGVRRTFGSATARLGVALAVSGLLVLLRREAIIRFGECGEAGWQAAAAAFVGLDLLLLGWLAVPSIDRSLYRGTTEAAVALKRSLSARSEAGAVRIYWPTDPLHLNREYDAEQRVKFGYLTFADFGPRDVGHWWEMREALLPNAAMLDSVASANNFDPLLVRRYAVLLEAVIGEPGLLRVMGVTHVVSDEAWTGGIPVHEGGSSTVYRLPGGPGRAWIVPVARRVPPDEMLAALADPAFDPAAEVLLEAPASDACCPPSRTLSQSSISVPPALTLRDAPNRVTIHATLSQPGYLVLADTWYPGWQAMVDGEAVPLLRANYAFRAVSLGAGEHVVEVLYRPASVRWGGAVSAITLVGLALGPALGRLLSAGRSLSAGRLLSALSRKRC